MSEEQLLQLHEAQVNQLNVYAYAAAVAASSSSSKKAPAKVPSKVLSEKARHHSAVKTAASGVGLFGAAPAPAAAMNGVGPFEAAPSPAAASSGSGLCGAATASPEEACDVADVASIVQGSVPGLGDDFLLAGLRYFQGLESAQGLDSQEGGTFKGWTPKSRLIHALLEDELPTELSGLQRDLKCLTIPAPAASARQPAASSGLKPPEPPLADDKDSPDDEQRLKWYARHKPTKGGAELLFGPAQTRGASENGFGLPASSASAPPAAATPPSFGAPAAAPASALGTAGLVFPSPSGSSVFGSGAAAAFTFSAEPFNPDTFWAEMAAKAQAANEAGEIEKTAITRMVALRAALEVRATKEADLLREAARKVNAIITFGASRPKEAAPASSSDRSDSDIVELLGRLARLRHRVEQRVMLRAAIDRAQQVSLPAVVDLPDLAATSPYSALMNRVCSGADAEAWTHGLKALRDEQQALAEALQRAIAKQRRAWDGTDVSATVDEIETIVAEIDRLAELLGSQGVGDHQARGDAAEESRQAAAKLAQFDALKYRHDRQLQRVDRCRTRVQHALKELAASFELGANEMAGVAATVELHTAQMACDCAIKQCDQDANAEQAGEHESILSSAAVALARPIKAEAARLAQRQRELSTWEEARALLLLLLDGGRKAPPERSVTEVALLSLAKLLLEMRQGTGKHVESTWMLPSSARSQAGPTREKLLKAQQVVREADDTGLEAARDARDLTRILHLDALKTALNSGPAGSEVSWPPWLLAGSAFPSLGYPFFNRVAAEREVQQPGRA